MIDKTIDIEGLIAIMDNVPRKTPWFYVLYAYIVSHMRSYEGHRELTAHDIKMPIKTLRLKFLAMEVLGFSVPLGNSRRTSAQKKALYAKAASTFKPRVRDKAWR